MGIKKLIEVALPLEAISKESAREKTLRHGHPSTLHLWWSRKPLATSRAVIWASLVDDPSSHLEMFPTEEEQNQERQRLFKILEDLVVWENSSNQDVLNAAKAEIIKSTNGTPPTLLDPFAGGGSIPLEALRLGIKAVAHDLNPVAVVINKAMIEIPSRFSAAYPVNPRRNEIVLDTCRGTQSLAADVRYYGEWMKKEAFSRIGHLYPCVRLPQTDEEATVMAWIWARTVKCPNPGCGCEVPLASSYVFSKKKGKEAWAKISCEKGKVSFSMEHSPYSPIIEHGSKFVNDKGKGKRGVFSCSVCKTSVDNRYIDEQASKGKMGSVPLGIVAEAKNGRQYLTFEKELQNQMEQEVSNYYDAHDIESKVPNEKGRGTFASNAQGNYYGFYEFKDYFTKRQLIMLTTFSDLIEEVKEKVVKDALAAGMPNDHINLNNGGSGAQAYGQAIAVYLSFIVDKLADYHSSVCSWNRSREILRNTFGLQGISMMWDYTEGNPFSNSSGSYDNMLEWIIKSILKLPSSENGGEATIFDAQSDCGLRDVMISTDPPYYDNVGYSDLSDYFYVWMKRTLKSIYPELFLTTLVPKAEELIASPYRHEGSSEKAKDFFETGMAAACHRLNTYTQDEVPLTIYYAYKQNDVEKEGVSSSGWETMLSAVIQSDFVITGTWPIRTELTSRSGANGANSLASSVVLVCRKRPIDAQQTTRRNLINTLRRELRPALRKLQESNIAPVDLAQSAIGPGMAVFSRYQKVLEADGTPMSIRSALQIINEEIDLYFNEQVGDLDAMSRFCIDLYTQNAFNDIKFGDADILARAKGTSVAAMASHDVLYAKAGTVHLIERAELPEKIDTNENCIWLLTQQLTQTMATGGVEACAQAVFMMLGSNGERAKDLAYRLYTIAEQKKWANEAYAYNALVVAWPDIQSQAAMLKRNTPEQLDMFNMGLLDNQ